MKVIVEVEKMKIVVPCGAGEQKLKWLGLVAAQRHALAVPHGRTRAREENDEKRGLFLPRDVLARDGSSLAPDLLIKDVLGDGELVSVELQRVVEVDDIGAPILSPWATSAFATRGAASERRARGISSRASIATHEAEINAEVTRRAREDERYRSAHEAAALAEATQGTGYNVVVTGHLETAEEAAAALDLDWPAVSESLQDLRCHPGPTAKEAFKDELRRAYGDLNRIFVHYAGLGRVGATHGVSLGEFCHYAHISRLARYRDKSNTGTEKQERNRMLGCFASAQSRRAGDGGEKPKRRRSFDNARGGRDESKGDYDVAFDGAVAANALLSRAEFVAALVHLAMRATPGAPTLLDELAEREEQHREESAPGGHATPASARGGASHDSPRGESRHGKADRRAHAAGGGAPESPMAALEHLLARHVAPFLSMRKAGVGDEGVLLSVFDGCVVQDAVQVQRAHLTRVFDHYARLPRDDAGGDASDRDSPRRAADREDDLVRMTDPGLCLGAFKSVLKDSGLMDLVFTEQNANEKLDKVAISAFLAVQNDPNFNLELDELVFVEFLEAYCRVANDMLDADELDTRMLLGIDMLSELSLNLP